MHIPDSCWQYGQYHHGNKYIFIIVKIFCVSFTCFWNILQKLVVVYVATKISTMSQPCFFAKWFEVGYISYCSSFCMFLDMCGPAWHICPGKYIIYSSTQYLPNLPSMAAKAPFKPQLNNQLESGTISLSWKHPVYPTWQYPFQGHWSILRLWEKSCKFIVKLFPSCLMSQPNDSSHSSQTLLTLFFSTKFIMKFYRSILSWDYICLA